MTSVRAFADPVFGIAGPPIEFARPERATLADLIALVPLHNEALRPHLRVKLGGEIIDPALYHRILPKVDAFVTIVLPVHGGKNGILGTLAVIALVGASLFVGGGGLAFLGSSFASGALGASLVSGGLSLAASLLLQGLNAQQQQDSPSSKEIGVASAQNAFEPGAYLQRVMGTRKVTPQMVMPPYSRIDGDDQIVTAVYGLAGPHQITGIKVGTADIDGAADISYEVREGFASDTNLTLVTDTRIEVAQNLRLSRFRMQTSDEATNKVDTTISPYVPQWHRVETKIGPDRAKLYITFDQGLIYANNSSGTEPAITALRVRIRKKGETSWYNLPEFLLRGQKQSGALRVFLDFYWYSPGSMPGSVTAFTANYGGFSWMYQSVVDSVPNTYWTADSYFATNKIDWANKQQVKVYLNTDTFPQDGAYEIEVIRGYSASKTALTITSSTIHTISANGVTLYDFFATSVVGPNTYVPNAQSFFVDGMIVSAIQSIWDEYPFDFTNQPTALIAIEARNRSLEQVTCLASGYASTWDGAAWNFPNVTSNPAAAYRQVLQNTDLNAEPVPTSLVDAENLQDWYEWCASEGWEVNAIVQGQPVNEVLSLIAQSGMARPRYSATYGVVIDRPREPVTIITQRNASGFAFQKPFGRLPHALKVNLADEDADYEVREVIVYDDGYNSDGSGGLTEASRFESITYQGLTSEALVIQRAHRDMRFARYRSRLITFSVDIEHLEYQLGDLVLLETDILGQVGGRGRVKAITTSGGLITELTLDEQRDFTKADADTAQRAVAMRLMDGTIRVEKVTSADADLNKVVFTTPFAMPTDGSGDLIVPGTLVVTGAYGQEGREVLIWDIAPGPDLTAQITAIDFAADQIYGGSGFTTGFLSTGFR